MVTVEGGGLHLIRKLQGYRSSLSSSLEMQWRDRRKAACKQGGGSSGTVFGHLLQRDSKENCNLQCYKMRYKFDLQFDHESAF